jgi:hypothetical protein
MEDRGHASDRALHRLEVGQLAADDLEPPVTPGEVEIGPAAGREVVEHPDAVPLVEESLDDV